MRTLSVVAVFAFGVASLAARSPAGEAQVPTSPTVEPAALTQKLCGTCHSPARLAGTQATRAEWERIVGAMVDYGMQASPQEQRVIVDYLAGAFPLPASEASRRAETTSRTFVPITDRMLLNPSPDDWLMLNRTYDNQRFSPLDQINQQNVSGLRMVWSRGLPEGITETTPVVYRGVMYIATAPAGVQALDATTGDLVWDYRRKLPDDIGKFISVVGRSRTLALYEDMVFYAAPDGFIVALDARNGRLRWETRAHDYRTNTQHTSGLQVVSGKVITGRACHDTRSGCFIAAHDARTGKELWKFYTTAGPGESGGDTWANLETDRRIASPWGVPGSFDPSRNLLYWGVANPSPHTRMKRHGGNADAVPFETPSELYTNSTVALDPETGRLAWYYQYLPGDDWDADHTEERILFRTKVDPDPAVVKWVNPGVKGQERDVVVQLGEPGGLWVLDRQNGQFLWAMPFPYDTPYFHISDIGVETGRTRIDRKQVLFADGQSQVVCYYNTKSYWGMAYHPSKNAMYIPYHDACIERIGRMDDEDGHVRNGIFRPGSDPDKFTGIAKVDMATGRVERLHEQRFPSNGSVLLTAGNLVFWGDMNRRFRAFDADSGRILWETIVGGITQASTITYAADGRQYVAVMTGWGVAGTAGPLRQIKELQPPRGHNAVYVFALPARR